MLQFLRSLFRPLNPTEAWKEDPSIPLVVDLDRHRLCGVHIGESLARLAFLGPATGTGSTLSFPSKGISVGSRDGLITSFAAYVAPAPEEAMGPFSGEFRYRERPLDLSEGTTERDLITAFGPPYWRDQDEVEVILFYEFGEYEWQIEMSPNDRLKLFVIAPPLLADPKQRAAYGVTKPWPPP